MRSTPPGPAGHLNGQVGHVGGPPNQVSGPVDRAGSPRTVDAPRPAGRIGPAGRNRPTGRGRRSGRTGPDTVNWALAGGLVSAVSLLLAILDARLHHWFLLPVTACGVLIALDVVGWFRRQFDIFDPQALLGLLGLHFFYLAPILHVTLDHWALFVSPPQEWRDALGAMAILNLIGLLIYRWLLSYPVRGRHTAWRVRLNVSRFYLVGSLAVAAGVLAFGFEIVVFGGLSGFLAVMTQDREALTGMGWLLMLAESFPLIAFALVLVRWREALARRRSLVVWLLVSLAAVQFLVGGLRGSRSNTVWPMLLALILVHLIVFTISRKALLVCGLIFVLFMYLYGLYKSAGVEVVDVVRGDRSIEQISSETGRDLPKVLLNDLARADMQAVLLERKRHGEGDLGYGVTYLGAVTLLAPGWLLPERPTTKLVIGTEVLLGPGSYDRETGQWATRIYGIAGEAMLNFGPVGAVASFVPLGLLVRWSRRFYRRARDQPDLVPKLLAPALGVATVLVLSSDLDNIVVFLLGRFIPLATITLLALTSTPLSPRPLSPRPLSPRSRANGG
ncbi:hypothetical protein OG792_10030 [Micromonospora sp. NBC_01699]|uniref:hypothetical protein n=1 Tax=Micromonospora sp. NBC_01699 TaxID=2975984 RepID=UPI002E2FFE03|nr:hypothetical protein [Micromonospora sp. NBC_01699]